MNTLRHDWTPSEVAAIYQQSFNELMFQAATVHRVHFNHQTVQTCTLLSVKTGNCPEDCGYCSQSGHFKTAIKKEKLLPLDEVIEQAKQAKAQGASRFCMGAAWRSPPEASMPDVINMISAVRELGLETCLTAGMLNDEQAKSLKEAGLDYYNHNLDTSPEYYSKVITTRTYQDRLDTLARLREQGINVCCGGIVGMGESQTDRIELLRQLANLPAHPQSVPINLLTPVEGTPLGETPRLDNFEFIRTIATARIIMPQSMVRLSAGRDVMSDEMQAWCFFAGANSIFLGDTLLTCSNASTSHDQALLSQLGLSMSECHTASDADGQCRKVSAETNACDSVKRSCC